MGIDEIVEELGFVGVKKTSLDESLKVIYPVW
jgi:hypothetical protein